MTAIATTWGFDECPFCWEMIDAADSEYHWPNYGGQTITECPGCHRKFEVCADAEFDDGMWRDRSTIAPLLALTEHGWFWCIHCGKGNAKGWSDAEAKYEHDRDFPGLPIENAATICDDCYNQFTEWRSGLSAFDETKFQLASEIERDLS